MRKLRGTWLIKQREIFLSKVASILADKRSPITKRAEEDFDVLQLRYPNRPEYGYDPVSFFERAALRSIDVLRVLKPEGRKWTKQI